MSGLRTLRDPDDEERDDERDDRHLQGIEPERADEARDAKHRFANACRYPAGERADHKPENERGERPVSAEARSARRRRLVGQRGFLNLKMKRSVFPAIFGSWTSVA